MTPTTQQTAFLLALEKPYKTITLTTKLTIKDIAGQVPTSRHYDTLLDENVRVYKPDGSLLLHLCREGIDEDTFQSAHPFIRKTQEPIKNRSMAAGVGRAEGVSLKKETLKGYQTRTHQLPDKLAKALGSSAIVGYYDRYTRMPFARICRWNYEFPLLWEQFLPLAQLANSYFRVLLPKRWAIQQAIAQAINPAWIIPNTVYSTVTINKTFQTSFHKDAGDLHEGFGCLAYFQVGQVEGGLLVFPEFRVAVKLKHCDMVLFDVHEWHGNTKIEKKIATSERITCVFYLREKLLRCGTPEYEEARAKRVRSIGSLYDAAEISKANNIKTTIMSRFNTEKVQSHKVHP